MSQQDQADFAESKLTSLRDERDHLKETIKTLRRGAEVD